MSSSLTTVSPCPVVLVGCGAVARQFYLPALRVLQNAGRLKVAGLVDPSPEARRRLASAFPRARAAAALDRINAPAGALAVIASPPRFHAEQTLAALARGWHVLCEKPMAATSAEAADMVAAAERHGRLLAVGLYKRFFPASRYLHVLCQQGLLGPLRHFLIREGGPFRWPASPAFFDRAQTPGGVLLDVGVHVLDLLEWWLGEPADFRYADDAMGGLEANACLELHYSSGVHGRLQLSRDWDTAQQYRLTFERGTVIWQVNDANGLTLQLDGAPAALQSTLVTPREPAAWERPPEPLETNAQSFLAQLGNVLAAIDGRQALLVPGAAGLSSLRLIEQCYARRTLLDQPWLTSQESQEARTCLETIAALS